MTIQFAADDGKMHKFKTASDAALIPGSASEIAYRSGAAASSAKQVSVVKSGQNFGMLLFSLGILSIVIAATIWIIQKARSKPRTSPAAPITTPVIA